ncbi:hypothetical protein MBLNU230_g8089t1 [Neophaeotheca triangularis]
MYCSIPILDARSPVSKSAKSSPTSSRSNSTAPPSPETSAAVTEATGAADMTAPAVSGRRWSASVEKLFGRRESNFKAYRDYEF